MRIRRLFLLSDKWIKPQNWNVRNLQKRHLICSWSVIWITFIHDYKPIKIKKRQYIIKQFYCKQLIIDKNDIHIARYAIRLPDGPTTPPLLFPQKRGFIDILRHKLIFLLTNRQIMEYIPMLTRCLITTRPNDMTCWFGVVMVRITTWNSWWSLSKRTPSQTSPTCQVRLLSEAGKRINRSLFSFSNIKKITLIWWINKNEDYFL